MATCTKSKSREAVDGGAGGTELPHRMHGRQDSRLKQNARIRTGGQAGNTVKTGREPLLDLRGGFETALTHAKLACFFALPFSSPSQAALYQPVMGGPANGPGDLHVGLIQNPGHYLALLWRLRPGRIGPPCRPRLRWRAAAPKLVYRDTRTSCLQMPAIVCWLPDKVPSTSRLGADSLHPGPPRVYRSCPDRTGTFFQYHHLSLSLPLYY